MRKTANFLIENEFGEFVCVSRKTDHNEFGLPGGKAEPNETILETAMRETLEETGIVINPSYSKNPVKVEDCGGTVSYTYYIKVQKDSIVFNHNEPHVVKWGTKEDLINGPFGDYNRRLFSIMDYVSKDDYIFKKNSKIFFYGKRNLGNSKII